MNAMDLGDRETEQRHDGVEQHAEAAGRKFEGIGRAGWVAKGIVYALIGVLFLQIAWLGDADEEANQRGAVEKVAETSFGSALLLVLACGLALYVIWRLFTVVLPGDWTGRALLDRIGYAVSAVVYLALLVSTVDIIVNDQSDSGAGGEDRFIEGMVTDIMSMTAGRWLIAAAGLVVIGIGVAFAHKGWTRSFRDDISGDTGIEGTLNDRLGVIGWIARGAIMNVIGGFLILSAYRFEPDEAAGFDDSIRQLASTRWGAALAVLIAIGFIAYGAFCIVSARFQDLQGPTND